MTRLSRRARALVVLTMISWPAVAAACPVCLTGSERSRAAFFNTTVFLSLLPLGMIGAGVWWLRRVGGVWLSQEFVDRDAFPPAEDAVVPHESSAGEEREPA